jgi:hypothetical protein
LGILSNVLLNEGYIGNIIGFYCWVNIHLGHIKLFSQLRRLLHATHSSNHDSLYFGSSFGVISLMCLTGLVWWMQQIMDSSSVLLLKPINYTILVTEDWERTELFSALFFQKVHIQRAVRYVSNKVTAVFRILWCQMVAGRKDRGHLQQAAMASSRYYISFFVKGLEKSSKTFGESG